MSISSSSKEKDEVHHLEHLAPDHSSEDIFERELLERNAITYLITM